LWGWRLGGIYPLVTPLLDGKKSQISAPDQLILTTS